jgi:hypothetical protein
MYLEEMITFTTIFNKNPSWKMDILLWSGFLLAFCEVVVAGMSLLSCFRYGFMACDIRLKIKKHLKKQISFFSADIKQ